MNKIVIIIGSMLAIILSIGLGLFVSRKITKPISELSNTVDEVSRGNFDVEVKTQTGIKEISILADSLNRIMTTMKYAISKTGATKEEIMTGEKSETSTSNKKEIKKSVTAVKGKSVPAKKPVVKKVVNEKSVPVKKPVVKEPLKKPVVDNEDGSKK